MRELLVGALEIGLSRRDFWQMTPREYYRELEAAQRRSENDHRHLLTQAWMTASLTRRKKMPDLDEVLKLVKGKRRITKKQTAAKVALMSDLLGFRAQPLSEASKRALRRLRKPDGQ